MALRRPLQWWLLGLVGWCVMIQWNRFQAIQPYSNISWPPSNGLLNEQQHLPQHKTTALPLFPRWNTTSQISVDALIAAARDAYRGSDNQKLRRDVHVVHVLDSRYRLWSLVVSNSSSTRQHVGRARAMTTYFGRRAMALLQEHRHAYPALSRLLSTHGGVVMLANYGDSHLCTTQWPILTLSAPLQCPTAFPVPNYELVKLALQQQRRHMMKWQTPLTHNFWQRATPKVLWRGSPTGYRQPERNARVQLCQFVHNHPNVSALVDAKIVLTKPHHHTMMSSQGHLTAPRKSSFDGYRAVLDIDGNSWSSRFASLLCQGLLVLKVAPQDVDAFFPTLIPEVHYLPVWANLSNLQHQAKRAVTDFDLVHRVTQQAQAWCRSYVTLPNLALETARTWEAYASVLVNGNDNHNNVTQLLHELPFEQHHWLWNRKDVRFRATMTWKQWFVWP